MATHLWGLSRHANSGSLTTSAEHLEAAEKNGQNSDMPGEATQRSYSPRTSSVPRTTSTPADRRARDASPSLEVAPPYSVTDETRERGCAAR